jgi:hypothetical protein
MNPCPYSMGDTLTVFLLLAAIAVGGPLFMLWWDNR